MAHAKREFIRGGKPMKHIYGGLTIKFHVKADV